MMNKIRQEQRRIPHNKGMKGFTNSGSFKKGNIPWNKGKPRSEDTKRKISEKNKGRKYSEETKKKMKGRIPWNKGKKGLQEHSEETKKKMSELLKGKRVGKKHPMWKGGRKNEKGYILIYSPDHKNNVKKYVPEHRLVVEKKIGRYLKKEEVVHHINEKKDDNRIENLMLFKNTGTHMSFHRKIQQFGLTNPIKRQIKNRWTIYEILESENEKKLLSKTKRYPEEINIISIKTQGDIDNLELL